jgi:beta-aspartyl-peptidase (threonine type)
LSGSRWAVIVHGGAKDIAPQDEDRNRRGGLEAAAAGAAVLERGGPAVEAVEAAIRVLEDDPTFNAGFGSVLTRDGRVEMDAALMDGSTLDIGAVAAVPGVRHPISVARLLVPERPTLVVGEGAREFAVGRGAEVCPPQDMIAPQDHVSEASRAHDTVGCVALDRSGHVAAGTSTGGLPDTMPGRVGDSPLPGCGFYADDLAGGVAFSGDGEDISRTMLAARVIQALEGGQAPRDAASSAIARLGRTGGEAGAIVIDARGEIGWAHNSTHFAVAWKTSMMDRPAVRLRQDEA